MAINKNHEFEELDGVKCGIVEKNVSPERVEFLKKLLEYNKFTVVVVPSPPPKVAAAPVVKAAEGEETPASSTTTCTCGTRNIYCWCNRLHIQYHQCYLWKVT